MTKQVTWRERFYSVMASVSNMTTVKIEAGCVGYSNDDEVLERSIDLSIGILMAILNIAEIIIILKIKRKKKVYEILLLSLSVSDCMLSFSNGFLYVLYGTNACKYEVLLETAFTLYIFSVLSSIFHISLIALDRLLAVSRPLKHKVFSTRKKAYLSSGLLWILAILISALLQVINELTDTFRVPDYMKQKEIQSLQETQEKNSSTKRFFEEEFSVNGPPLFTMTSKSNYHSGMEYTLSVVILVADVLIFSIYSLIIYHITSYKKMTNTKTKQKKLPIVCLAIGATFVLFTLPFVVAKLVLGYIPPWANRTLILNGGMNSIVYFFGGKLDACVRKKNNKSIKVSPIKVCDLIREGTSGKIIPVNKRHC